MNNLYGVYGGIVEAVDDPDQVGRIKARVPGVFGTAAEVPTNSLPWALPRGLPFGSSRSSGGISWLPVNGDTVWVTFLDGEPEKPLWEWAVAPVRNAAYLHKYENKAPKRAALTRYGHVIEFNASSIIITTPTGEAAIFDTVNNAIQLQNAAQHVIRMDLDGIMLRAGTQIVNVDGTGLQINTVSKDLNVVALQDITAQSQAVDITALRSVNVQAASLIKLETPDLLELEGLVQASLASEGTLYLHVGASEITLTPASISLMVGSRMLTISAEGFTFV